jgi:hypothetical protein
MPFNFFAWVASIKAYAENVSFSTAITSLAFFHDYNHYLGNPCTRFAGKALS